jgi:hypothetical protein
MVKRPAASLVPAGARHILEEAQVIVSDALARPSEKDRNVKS